MVAVVAAAAMVAVGSSRLMQQWETPRTKPETAIASDVTECPVSPKDILATTYHLAGIDPAGTITDRFGQPRPIGGDGRVLSELIG